MTRHAGDRGKTLYKKKEPFGIKKRPIRNHFICTGQEKNITASQEGYALLRFYREAETGPRKGPRRASVGLLVGFFSWQAFGIGRSFPKTEIAWKCACHAHAAVCFRGG